MKTYSGKNRHCNCWILRCHQIRDDLTVVSYGLSALPCPVPASIFMSSGVLDATLNKEKKEAVKMIVERNAHKKMDEQSSSDPEKKNKRC